MSVKTVRVVLADSVPNGGSFQALRPADLDASRVLTSGHQLVSHRGGNVYAGIELTLQDNTLLVTNATGGTLPAGEYVLGVDLTAGFAPPDADYSTAVVTAAGAPYRATELLALIRTLPGFASGGVQDIAFLAAPAKLGGVVATFVAEDEEHVARLLAALRGRTRYDDHITIKLPNRQIDSDLMRIEGAAQVFLEGASSLAATGLTVVSVSAYSGDTRDIVFRTPIGVAPPPLLAPVQAYMINHGPVVASNSATREFTVRSYNTRAIAPGAFVRENDQLTFGEGVCIWGTYIKSAIPMNIAHNAPSFKFVTFDCGLRVIGSQGAFNSSFIVGEPSYCTILGSVEVANFGTFTCDSSNLMGGLFTSYRCQVHVDDALLTGYVLLSDFTYGSLWRNRFVVGGSLEVNKGSFADIQESYINVSPSVTAGSTLIARDCVLRSGATFVDAADSTSVIVTE